MQNANINRILVTGGAGFIGSHIADAYLARGHRVVIIDNLSAGFRRNVNPRAIFYRADILNYELVTQIIKREKIDIINHHAAKVSVAASVKNPNEAFSVNTIGTLNLLNAFGLLDSKRIHPPGTHRRKKFVFASTAGVYGDPAALPARESMPPAPRSPYGLSKLLGEEAVAHHARAHDFNYTIFRYANVYGPRQNIKSEAGVVAIFTNLMQLDIRPTIFGDGTKTRDYIFIDDVVRANVAALARGRNQILNLGTSKETTDEEIFTAIAAALNFKKQPRFAPFREGEIRRMAIDAGNAKKILGWKPKTPLEEGIRKTVSG